MTSQSLGEPLTLKQTNVSNPSIVHPKPSQASITASEDYYSLSGSTDSDDTVQHVPSPRVGGPEYATPFQSRSELPQQQSTTNIAAVGTTQDAYGEGVADEEVRKTPMRGEGKRRSSQSYPSDLEAAAGTAAVGGTALREGGIRRKPVGSAIMEARGSPSSQEFIDQTHARSSVAQDLDREGGGMSPEVDDTPFIRFALDQLTRDEEVRGSRTYPDGGNGEAFVDRGDVSPVSALSPEPSLRRVGGEEAEDRSGHAGTGAAAALAATAGVLGVGAVAAHEHESPSSDEQRPIQQYHTPPDISAVPAEPAQAGTAIRRSDEPNLFVPVANENGYHQFLDFLPAILRPLWFLIFIVLVFLYVVLLLLAAIWSLTHKGIVNYGYFGDAKYFLFQYVPIIFGMILYYWLVQIQVAVYRIAPFIAMASDSGSRIREEGSMLPIYPKTFFFPFIGHFRAGQPLVGFFMVISWLQIFTIPLLASAFNVRTVAAGGVGTWRWIATAAAIWVVIGLYVLQIIASTLLLFWLRSQRRRVEGTGLRWDPRSFADLIVLLERSNALSMTEHEEVRLEAPKLGYWRTSRGGSEVFHSYGVPDRSARRYSLDNGRIREKVVSHPEPRSRFSDFEDDREMGREQRHSREKMLPKHAADDEAGMATGGRAVPWFLRSSLALLWAITAFVLWLAFVIVSYLPSTTVSKGFNPLLPASTTGLGYSGTNFVYSFIPAIIAMICFLGMLDIDFAYRRIQPFAALLSQDGEIAERSLLVSYCADLPVAVTVNALANGHWRVVAFSLSSLLAITLPILGGSVFWAQFNVPTQSVRIFTDMPGYYALTFFVSIYAFAIIVFIFPNRDTRDLNHELPRGNRLESFRDILRLVRMSRMLDDIAFHNVTTKTDLVTRLFSSSPGAPGVPRPQDQQEEGASKVSLADNTRGFGHARQNAVYGTGQLPRYGLGRYVGRDGREYTGVDQWRR